MYNLNLTSDEEPQNWVFSQGYDFGVDFFVWVLEVDGLQVPPFEGHSEGDRSLRSRGMTVESWQSWLTKSVQHLHYGRLLLNHERHILQRQNLQPRMKQFALDAAKKHNLDLTVVEAKLDRHFARQEEAQQRGLAAARQIYGDATPPDVERDGPLSAWEGEPAVSERLRELRSEFRSISQQRSRYWDWLMNRKSEDDQSEPLHAGGDRTDLWIRLKPYHPHLSTLKIYLVAYPQSVEYLAPPISLILSASPESRTRQIFDDRVVGAAARLAQINQA